MQVGKILKGKIKNTLRFLPALRLVWYSSPSWTIARVILVAIQGILPLATIYLTKLIIDTVTTGLTATDKTTVFRQVFPLLLLAGAVTIFTTLCTSLTELVNTAHSQQVTDYMQGIIHAKSIEADLEYYENAKYHDALQRAQQEAPYRPPQILNRLAEVGQNGISLIAMIGLLLSLHWGIIGILLVATIPAVLVRVKYSRIMYRWERRRTQLERQSMYLGWMLTDNEFAKEIRLFDLGSFFSQWYLQIRKQLYKERLAIATGRSFSYFFAQATAGILVFAIFAYIIYQTIQGVLLLGDLVLYYQALQRGQNNLRGLLTSISGLYEDNLFLANLYEFLDLKPKVVEPAHPKIMPRPMHGGVVFDRVSFQYPDTTNNTIGFLKLLLRKSVTLLKMFV
jgi:ATP-binding cassette subfamily B protein